MSKKAHQAASDLNQLDRLIPLPEVRAITSFSKATIYRKISETPPTFPAPLNIGQSRVAWRQSDIAKWLNEQPPST